MKLSARDKQRVEWGLAILIGGAAVLYAYVHFLVTPLMQARVDGLNKLADYQEKIDTATIDLRNFSAVSNEVARLQRELAVSTNRFVITPVLGSTLVSVQNIIEPVAHACGLQIETCVERGRSEVPVNKKDAGFVIERYVTEIAAVGDYGAVRDFLQAIEQTNAYVCVTDIEIVDLPGNIMKHKARMSMEWPVFGERKVEAAPARASKGGGRAEDNP